MSTPFERLRMVIDRVGVQTFHITHHEEEIEEPQHADVYECHRYTVSHSRDKSRQKPKKSIKSVEYYSREDLLKIRSLYEEEKQRRQSLEVQNQRLSRELRLQDESFNELNRTFFEKNKQLQQIKTRSGELDNQTYLRLIGQKQKVYKVQIDKLNEILDQLNKQLNTMRQKYKTLESQTTEKTVTQNNKIQVLLKQIQERNLEIKQLESNVEERKKLLEFNIQSHQDNLRKKEKQHEGKSQEFTNSIKDLNRRIQELNQLLSGHDDRHRESGSKILSYQHSIERYKEKIDAQSQSHLNEIDQLKDRIATLVKSLEQYQSVEKRNEQLQRLIEDEKAKQKYHIVEVKDETLELEVQMLKSQVKELLKSRAIAEEKLKRSCNCIRTTLAMKEQQSGLGQTIKYMQGHEIKIVKQ